MQLRRQSKPVLAVLDTAIGTLLCASIALILALLFNQTRLEVSLPLICLAVVVSVAARFGVATGVLGSLVSALLLAYFVYAPQHSLRIVNHDARANLSSPFANLNAGTGVQRVVVAPTLAASR